MPTLNELTKLPPEERIKRLKQLQQEHEEEIKQAQQLIKESSEQIVREKETEQLRRFVPQQKQIDITDLFKEEEQQSVAQRAKEAPKLSEEEVRQYGMQLARERSLDELSRSIYAREQTVHEKGYANPEDAQDLKIAAYAMHRKEEEYKSHGMLYEARKASRTQEEVEHLLNMYAR
ncbi:hypothetical protein HY491_01130 [Candidatus Woesearchaeota archaeon]|nr:hypothetical protein [Candidatus Woesearchaeota archaeon]